MSQVHSPLNEKKKSNNVIWDDIEFDENEI